MSDRNKVNLMSEAVDAVCGDVWSSSAEIFRDLLSLICSWFYQMLNHQLIDNLIKHCFSEDSFIFLIFGQCLWVALQL